MKKNRIKKNNGEAASSSVPPVSSSIEEVSPELDYIVEDGFLLDPGFLTESILSDAPLEAVLSLEEEANISKAKEFLSHLKARFEIKKELYRNMLIGSKKNITTIVTMRSASGKDLYELDASGVLDQLKKMKNQALEYINFLAKMAEQLTKKRSLRAEREYQISLDYAVYFFGDDDVNTLALKLDKVISGLCTQEYELIEKSTPQILEIIKKLENKLSGASTDVEVKSAIAVGYYFLAQYFLQKQDFEQCTCYLDRSEAFRKESDSSEEKLDRIKFLRGRLAFMKGNLDDSFRFLRESYDFRKKSPLNGDLISVLSVLSEIMDRKNKPEEEMTYLREMLQLQKLLEDNPRKIIETQLRMLKAMVYHASFDEISSLMDYINHELGKIPVTSESVDVTITYIHFIEVRENLLLPSFWSRSKRRDYYSDTLKLITKAEAHLRVANQDDQQIQEYKKWLTFQKESAIFCLDRYSDMRPDFIGEPVHPDDAAELEAIVSSFDEGSDKGSTLEQLIKLSEFSSEARHSALGDQAVLTVEEFNRLSDEGFIDPCKLRVAQGGINRTFRDRSSLENVIERLIADPKYTSQIPPVEIGVHEGKVYSFDTRRLISHQKAQEKNPAVQIRYKKITGQYLQERVQAVFSPRPWGGLVTAERFGGKGSESQAYINPRYRDQLNDSVDLSFKPYPSSRIETGADANGFPVKRAAAKKVAEFLKRRSENSEFAKYIIQKAKRVRKEEGEEAFYDYLIKIKNDHDFALSEKEEMNFLALSHRK